MKRYKEGIYQPDYAWLADFNKDPDHYRLEDYHLSPLCFMNLYFSPFLLSLRRLRRLQALQALQALRYLRALYT